MFPRAINFPGKVLPLLCSFSLVVEQRGDEVGLYFEGSSDLVDEPESLYEGYWFVSQELLVKYELFKSILLVSLYFRCLSPARSFGI